MLGDDYWMIPRMSSSRIIRNSSPSILISVPEYFPNRTLSPFLTSRGRTFPSSVTRPVPTAMISPWIGFSFAVSGMMIPPFDFSSSTNLLTSTRSCSGRTYMALTSSGFIGLNQKFRFCRIRWFRTPDCQPTTLKKVRNMPFLGRFLTMSKSDPPQTPASGKFLPDAGQDFPISYRKSQRMPNTEHGVKS